METGLQHHLETPPERITVQGRVEGMELSFRVVGRGGRRHHPAIAPTWWLALGGALLVLGVFLSAKSVAWAPAFFWTGFAALLAPLPIRWLRVALLPRLLLTRPTSILLTPQDLRWRDRRLPLHEIRAVVVEQSSMPSPAIELLSTVLDGSALRRLRVITERASWEWELPSTANHEAEWLRQAILLASQAAGAGEPIPVEAEEVARITRGRE